MFQHHFRVPTVSTVSDTSNVNLRKHFLFECPNIFEGPRQRMLTDLRPYFTTTDILMFDSD